MHYVYLLRSKKYKTIYIGYSYDLKKRILLHNSGRVVSTRDGKPWELIYYEAYKSKSDATNREKMLKYDGKARTWLKKRNLASLKGAA